MSWVAIFFVDYYLSFDHCDYFDFELYYELIIVFR